MKDCFIFGLVVGSIFGMLLVNSSKEVDRFVDKTKKAVKKQVDKLTTEDN